MVRLLHRRLIVAIFAIVFGPLFEQYLNHRQ